MDKLSWPAAALTVGLWALHGLAAEAPPAVAAKTTNASLARITFAELIHDFGQIKRGEAASHSFIFTNTGTETLLITEVRPGCGCTTAGAWDKEVAPGQTGRIPLQFNSAGFSGPIAKSATVACNDPTQGNLYLQLKGTVWTPLEITPTTLMFQYDAESAVGQTQTVRIVNHTAQALSIEPAPLTNRAFHAELMSVTPGKEFRLLVATVPPIGPGMVTASIALKTSSAETPTINVPVYALERPAVTVSPVQILLPAGALAGPMQQVVTIQSSSAKALVVSNAQINVPGAEVTVREMQPGRVFALSLSLPAGLKIEPGQNVALTVSSSHPKYPILRVPLLQPQPVVAAPVSTGASATPAGTLPAGMRFVPTRPPPPTAPPK